MVKSFSMFLAGVCFACVNLSSFVQAGTPLNVTVDYTQLMMLTSDPSTVVVGNPSIADVTINGRQLFVHGHSAGETNLMIFDQGGSKIGDYEVSVAQDTSNTLAVFSATSSSGVSRLSYVCAPLCERSLQVGDNVAGFSNVLGNVQQKISLAQGSTTSGAAASNPAAAAASPH